MPLITDTDTLRSLCEALKTEKFITVDTEFLRERTYYPQLCLIQIGSSKTAFAIDPLAPGIDLSPIFDIFADENILKVFHSARQDIEIVLGLSGHVPTPLFDTQVAAMVCGFGEAASYETLVTKLAGTSIDKSCRFTDWSQRPLSKQQYDYALCDVTHLRTVYEALTAMLQSTGRSSWLTEEMAALTNPGYYRSHPEDAWKKIKTKSSSPRFLQLVRELACWREMKAQAHNIPRNHFLKEQTLLEIAALAPKTAEELGRMRSISGFAAQAPYREEIMYIIHNIKNTPPAYPLEERKNLPPNNGPLVDLLKVLLKTISANHLVAERLIATQQDLSLIAHTDNKEELASLPALQGWRFEMFGQLALQLKKGEIALSANKDKMCIVTLANHGQMAGN